MDDLSLGMHKYHRWLLSSPKVHSPKSIARNDLARYEEVVLPKGNSALADMICKLPLSVHRNLLAFVHAEAINIQHLDLNTREMLDLFSNGGIPFTQAILNGRKF